jgi:hypothetical protein
MNGLRTSKRKHAIQLRHSLKEKEYKKKKELIDLTAKSQRAPYAAKLWTGYDACCTSVIMML